MKMQRLAPVLMILVAATACGGDDPQAGGGDADSTGGASASPVASKEAFCEIYSGAGGDGEESSPDDSAEESAEAVKRIYDRDAEKLIAVGAPADIPDDARAGYETLLEVVDRLEVDALTKSIEAEDVDYLATAADETELAEIGTFDSWASDYCG